MAETTLRDYIRTIDSLIDAEKLDEAIAHCRNILQFHPKHLETYRLLGKAYLEAKKHGDAADIFQRVLSAVPDDFVSHIGMSIVREDEGNTESAIWHMERAFETNPSNPAIQQEIKRLIGRRDGIEPPKVRLTRGALARMYAHGELYPQAIAELRSALREEPDRPDLQILLADLYWQTDQRVEAAEVSSRILEKLPYCQRALRIMAAALQETGKAQEATRYHRRLAQLDPYFAYVESPMMDTKKVEADSVRIEALAWQPGEAMPGAAAVPSDWASTLGIEISEEEEGGPLPAWMADVSQEDEDDEQARPAQPPAAADEAEAEAEGIEAELAGAELPDWMEEAGWEPSTGEVEEGPVSFSAEELSTLELGELPPEASESEEADYDQELEPAQIPSWLQEKAPGELPSVEEELAEADIPEWLDDLDLDADDEGEIEGAFEDQAEPISAADELESPPWTEEAEQEMEVDPEAADVPSWLDEGEPGATSTIMSWLGERPGEEQPEPEAGLGDSESWIDEAFQPEEAPAEPEISEAPADDVVPAGEEPGIPGWLAGMAEASASTEDTEREELDRFRQETAASISEEIEAEPEEAFPADVPDWLQQIAGAGEPKLEEPISEAAVDQERLESSVSEVEDQIPDETADIQEIEPEAEVAELEAEIETPDWLKESFAPADDLPEAREAEPDLEVEEIEPAVDEVTSGVVEEDEEVEDWLANLATAAPAAEQPAEQIQDEAEDWLSDLAEPLPGEETVDEEAETWLADLGEEPRTAGQTWAEMTASEPDWLDGLAEDEPDEQVEAMAGGWLDDLSETLADTPAEPSDDSMALEAEEVPDWLTSFEDRETQAQAETPEPLEPEAFEEPEEDEDLSWLQDIAEQASPEGAPPQPAAPPAPDFDMGELDQMDEDEIFQWLENMASQQEQEEPAAPEPAPRAETRPTTEPLDEPAGEDLEWLSKLAEQRGIDADLRPAQRGPAQEPATTLPESDTQPTSAARPPEPEEAQERAPEERPAEAMPWEDVPESLAERPVEQPPVPVETDPEPGPPPSFREEVQLERPGQEPREALPKSDEAEHPIPAGPEQVEEPPVPSEPQAPPPPSMREEVGLEEPGEAESEQLPAAQEPRHEEDHIEAELPAEPPTVTPLETAAQAPPETQGEEEVPDWLKPMAEQPSEAPAQPAAQEPAPEAPAEPPPIVPEPEPEPEPAPPAAQAPPVEAPKREPEPEAAPPAAGAPAVEEPEQEPEPAEPGTEPAHPSAQEPPVPEPEPEPAHPSAQEPPALEPEPEPAHPSAQEPMAPEPVEPEPKPAPKLPERLHAARAALAEGDHRTAASDYEKLLKGKEHLGQVIGDLESAVEEYPESAALWQTLGDAYMKAGRTKDAAQAYNEGMRETEVLESARQALAAGDHTRAAAQYGILIKDRKGLDTVIEDLEATLEEQEHIPIIWQTLGDAYMKAGRLNDSIKAYRQGMDSV